MNEKMLQGLMNAPKEKRYRGFVSRACDFEKIWVIDAAECLHVWAYQEMADLAAGAGCAKVMDVHDFMDAYADTVLFVRVGFNGQDACSVSMEQLLSDLEEELEQLE